LGTGGTIAAKGSTAFQTAGYHVDLTIEELIASIPDLSQTCELQFEQVFNLDSKEITSKELVHLRNKVQEAVYQYDGVVITHGTDSCEETSFFLDTTVDTLSKPVVMCGSMRPLTSVSADGPSNLYQACMVASHKDSFGRGILVTLNDKIGSGYYISKTDANSLDTFKSLGSGYLGNFVNGEVHYYF
ncbi:Asparaginase/glutaminase, partial [Metschnikowia bicuspidata]